MNRRTILTGGISAVVLGTAAAGLAIGLPTGTPKAEADNKVRKTAKVTKENLSDTETKSGTLGFGTETTITNRLNGTITALPKSGAIIKRGQVLYRVDDLPVVLFYGPLPFYRPITADTDGNDANQFAANRKALGYSTIKKWQKSLGLEQTGMVEPGRVVYAAGSIRVGTVTAAVGDGSGAVLKYTGTKQLVTVTMEVNDSRLAKVKQKVKITLPDGKVVNGTISATENTIEQSQQGGDPTTKIKVSIGLDSNVDLDQATVRVAFVASTREKVLTVPVAALLALREGGYGIEVVDGGTSKILAVTTGLFSSGRVEITGQGITEGMTVGMPS